MTGGNMLVGHNDDGHGVHYDPGSPDDHTLMVMIIHCLDVRGLAIWL